MAPSDRILRKLRSGASELSIREVVTLLTSLGWSCEEGTKHFHAVSPRNNLIPLPRHGKVDKRYLKQLLKEIDRGGGE